MKVIVIGGGIGGVTTALALHREGVEVEVLEKASAIQEIGAGIQISANATKALRHLGRGPALADIGVAAEAIHYRDLATDEKLLSVPLGQAAAERYGATFYQCHRCDLQRILLEGLPSGIVRTGTRCASIEQTERGATAVLESGERVHGDVVVGADGIHSVAKQTLHGPDEAEFARIIAYRCLIPAERVAPLGLERCCYSWLGRTKSAVAYYISSGDLFNFVGIAPTADEEEESWTTRGDVDRLRNTYAEANPTVRGLVDLIDETFVTGYYFRDPLPSWTSGRVTLLGDSAHAMHPFLAQGACQAIEDGVVLAGCLVRHGDDDVDRALAEYERKRWARTSEVQSIAKDEEKRWHMTDPDQIAIRNGVFRSIERLDPLVETSWGWLYHYDPVEDGRTGTVPSAEGLATMERDEAGRAWSMWDAMVTPFDKERGVWGIRDAYRRFLDEHMAPPADVRSVDVTVGGVPCVLVSPGEPEPDSPLFVHFHGGGYVAGSARTSLKFAHRLARATGGQCLVVDYRLAPEHPFPAAVDDAVAVLGALGDGSVLAGVSVPAVGFAVTGESAGGGLAVAACVALRDRGGTLPRSISAISPLVDLTVSGESVAEHGWHDPVCSRRDLVGMSANYLLGADPTDPLASPVHADLTGLPPMRVFVGNNEALRSDAERLVERAIQHDVDARLVAFDDTVHVFAIFDFLPEAHASLDKIARFNRELVTSAAHSAGSDD